MNASGEARPSWPTLDGACKLCFRQLTRRRRLHRLCILVCIFSVLAYISGRLYILWTDETEEVEDLILEFSDEMDSNETHKLNTVPSPLCKLPALNPFHKSIQYLLKDLGPLRCGRVHSRFQNNSLFVQADDVVNVTYNVIRRPTHNDFDSVLSEATVLPNMKSHHQERAGPFEGTAQVSDDFIRVDITTTYETIAEVHMQTSPKLDVLKRKVRPAGIPVNIAMIMFDSTSAANFIRKMPKTNAYLKTRPTVYMKGNTIVGDGTTAQLCAMLTGIPEEEQPEARRSKPNAKVVDDWRWVFRDYQKHGYVTMYSEDSPGLGTFNYRLKGFKNPPTDHYGRYFWFEAQRHVKSEHCAGRQSIHGLTMKYFLSMFRSYPNNPKFPFLLFSDLTHDGINTLSYADEDLVELLQTMDRESYLDDTIVFIFGDHGVRFGSMRQTIQGKLEERLPHMSITFPSWFPNKHPQLYNAIQQNSEVLTTPFDIYATLQHVLSYPDPPKGVNIGQSLLVPIEPENRTCSSSGVEDHWCPCLNFESVPVTHPVVNRLANYAVLYINKLLEKSNMTAELCHKLKLAEVKSILREMPNERVQKFHKSYADDKCDSCGVNLGAKSKNTLAYNTLYQIQFVTSPNDGFYEVSVKLSNGRARIVGSISRVDTYGHQPYCIQDTHVHLLKYCYCKT